MLQVVSEALVNEWVGIDALCIAVAAVIISRIKKRGRRRLVKMLRDILRSIIK